MVSNILYHEDPRVYVEDEYKYFSDFVICSGSEFENDGEYLLTMLQASAAGIADIYLLKLHDIDGIRIKCGDTLIQAFKFCNHLQVLKPCLPTDPTSHQTPNLYNIMTSDIMTSVRNLAEGFFERPHSQWDTPLVDLGMQGDMYTLTNNLIGLSQMTDIHDLMSMTIQTECHGVLYKQRMAHIKSTPHMKEEYERNSIYPWH